MKGLSSQHRVPRGAGGSSAWWINEPENLVTVCGDGTTGHHGWLESNRSAAYELGVLVRRARTSDETWQRVKDTPVMVRGQWKRPLGTGWRMALAPKRAKP